MDRTVAPVTAEASGENADAMDAMDAMMSKSLYRHGLLLLAGLLLGGLDVARPPRILAEDLAAGRRGLLQQLREGKRGGGWWWVVGGGGVAWWRWVVGSAHQIKSDIVQNVVFPPPAHLLYFKPANGLLTRFVVSSQRSGEEGTKHGRVLQLPNLSHASVAVRSGQPLATTHSNHP